LQDLTPRMFLQPHQKQKVGIFGTARAAGAIVAAAADRTWLSTGFADSVSPQVFESVKAKEQLQEQL
jgi:hypothetical protein